MTIREIGERCEQFFLEFLLQILLPALEKVRLDANVLIQLIVHITPFCAWREMNFQQTFFK